MTNLCHKKEKLNEIKTNEAKRHAKLIKDFYNEVNEGNPETTKRMITSLKCGLGIKKLKNATGELIDDPDKILDEFKAFYENLYKEAVTTEIEEHKGKVKNYIDRFLKQKACSIAKVMAQDFDEPEEITEMEVERAIMKLNTKSAPGSDGLTSSLYQSQKDFFIPFLTNDIHRIKRVPPSCEQAIIQVIPKSKKSLEVNGDFRPISLINTDLKILSHIITQRVKKLLDLIKGQHQSAHLSERNIHIAIMKLQSYALDMSEQESIVALDFSKAFDCVNRQYLLDLVDKMPFSGLVKNMIGTMYNKNLAYITTRSIISEPFEISRGVRQGCPLSALLFNLAIEPLLQRIQWCKRIKSKQKQKSVAYADDVSVCIKNNSTKNC